MNPYERPARECYERYSQHCGGRNHQGLPMPTWEGLEPDTRQHWMYAIAPLVKLKKD